MIDLQEYIDENLDSMDYEFRISREHMNAESDIVHDFLDEVFSTTDPDFLNYTHGSDLYELSREFGDAHVYFDYDSLRNWLVDPNHDGEYYFAEVIKQGLVPVGQDFDFMTTIQAAQIEEAIDAIHYAKETEFLGPVLAGMYMQSQGYEKVNEELLDKMGELIDTDNLTPSGLAAVLEEAKNELGLDDKDVGEKVKDDKNKDKGIEK